jgi:hypothetical protein
MIYLFAHLNHFCQEPRSWVIAGLDDSIITRFGNRDKARFSAPPSSLQQVPFERCEFNL